MRIKKGAILGVFSLSTHRVSSGGAAAAAAAVSRVLLTVSEKYSCGLRRGKQRPEKLMTMSRQYEVDLKLMRELYKRAEEVEEVAIMKVGVAVAAAGGQDSPATIANGAVLCRVAHRRLG